MDLGINGKYFIALGSVVFFLVVREAILLPLTHDEYSTIMVSYQSVWDIITYKDPIPNNHILNTLLLKLNITTFGDNLFTNRLHNVISFIPYFIFTVFISHIFSDKLLYQLLFVSMAVFQPFLLDFYSITRGYGLSISFQMASIYFALIFIRNGTIKFFNYSIILAAFGVLASFTLLNYYFPLLAVLFYFSYSFYYRDDLYLFKKSIFYALGISSVLAIICYLPFTKMVATNQFVFWDSNNFFKDTIIPLFHSLKVGVSYFKWNGETYSLVFLGIIFLLVLFLLRNGGKKVIQNKYFKLSFSLLVLSIVYNNLQFYLTKVPFLNARTALFFIPLVALFVFNVVYLLKDYIPKVTRLISIFLIFLCTQHFLRGYNGRANYEWYFNQNTYEILDDLMYEIHINNIPKPVKLDCHWFHHPSLTYHINDKYRGIIELLPYHKDTPNDSDALYYISEPGDMDVLSQNFIHVKQYDGGFGILWKKKQ